MKSKLKGRLTIPTDIGIEKETIEIIEKLGVDAIRDADGTTFPDELKNIDVKIYATYFTTRKDNDWARANPDEVQQCYLVTNFYVATNNNSLEIPLMKGISKELMMTNYVDDIKRWWEVIDRTTREIVNPSSWNYDKDKDIVTIKNPAEFHEYTVSFLAYLIWDPVHMYNSITNEWEDVENQITFDVRQPKTYDYSIKRLKTFIEENPHVDVIRFTTFFHQFTLIFDENYRQKYVDWYGYSASVSPYILEKFEKEVGYKFRAEFIIDEGYFENQYRIPSKEYRDFVNFQAREVSKLAKEFVDITHSYGKEAMMFLGDHWIGVEPFLDEFKKIGLDAVVGSVGNGSTLRLISGIKNVKYTEGRFLPYFFPDTFYEGGDPTKEARENWITARRAILREPIDRIGYGGYLKLALEFPDFIEYISDVADEFRLLYENIKDTIPYCIKKVAILNAWGKMRSWGNHMVHHAFYQKQNYCYAGVVEILSGAPFDVIFISFEDVINNPDILKDVDVIINVGSADTAHSGGYYWANETVTTTIKKFIYNGGGFIGVGEPTAHQYQGRFFQLATVLGVEKETGFTLGYNKYNWEVHNHFITEDVKNNIDFGESTKSIYAFENTKVLSEKENEIQLSVNSYGKGKSVYIGGLPYSLENTRLLHRAIMYASSDETSLNKWFSTNYNVDVHAYVKNNKYCVVNNTYEKQKTTIYLGDGKSFELTLNENQIIWYDI